MIARLRTFPIPTRAEIKAILADGRDLIAAGLMFASGFVLICYALFHGDFSQ